MSAETLEWLNVHTLIGFSLKRGKFWHYREEMQGGEPNHYEGAVPVADILRRLFNFKTVERPLYIPVLVDGEVTYKEVTDRKAVATDDTNEVLGIFKGGMEGREQYAQSLLHDTEEIAGHGAEFASAGLLQNRAVAWTQLEAAETLTVCGVDYRPFLMSVDSCGGQLVRSHSTGNNVTGCDNTMMNNLINALAMFKLKHTKYAKFDANKVRDALGILEAVGEEFRESVEALTNWAVTDDEWTKFLDQVCKFDADAKTTRSQTIAENKRADLRQLWETDERVTPWKNTAFGVLQATNTWNQHIQTVRGATRADRNMMNFITGATEKADTNTLKVLELVTA